MTHHRPFASCLRTSALVLSCASTLLPATVHAMRARTAQNGPEASDVLVQVGGVRPGRGELVPPIGMPPAPLTAPAPPVAPVALGQPGTRAANDRLAIATAVAPTSGRARRESGPVGARVAQAGPPALQSARGVQRARGGGPIAFPPRQVLRDDQAEVFPVSLPVGCTRLTVAGTPAVGNITVDVEDPNGRAVKHDAHAGRLESFDACVQQAGDYRVSVRMRARRSGVVASELFVGRQGVAGERVYLR